MTPDFTTMSVETLVAYLLADPSGRCAARLPDFEVAYDELLRRLLAAGQLQAENDRLRAALAALVDEWEQAYGYQFDGFEGGSITGKAGRQCAAELRRCLEPKEPR